MATRGGGDEGGDVDCINDGGESNRPASTDAKKTTPNKARPRPPRAVAPGDRAPGVGRVVDVRRAYDRYLSVEQVDVEVFGEGGGGAGGGGGNGGNGGGSGGGGEKKQQPEIVSFDVVSHPRSQRAFVVVFPFHPPEGSRGGDGGGGGGGKGSDAADADDAADANAVGVCVDGVPTVTLLREYCHGVNAWLYTLPTGGYDPKKHGGEGVKDGGIRRAAEAELSEEARLEGGKWECLLPDEKEEEEEEEEEPSSSSSFSNPLEAGIPEAKWCANRFWPFLCVGPREAPEPLRRDREEEMGTMEVTTVTLAELRAIVSRGRMLLPSVQASWMAIERLRELGYAVD